MQSIIKKQAVRLTATPEPCATPTGRPGGPAVELLERDGVVHGLQVTCACGETTVVELEYADAPPQGATSPEQPAATPDQPDEVRGTRRSCCSPRSRACRPVP